MKLTLKRKLHTMKSTTGELYVDGIYECDTLEDVTRPDGEKVFGETAIPYGTYKVILDYSPHFKRILPHILNVSNFEGVRIHSGNKAEDTEGCILVGRHTAKDWISHSRDEFNELFAKLEKAENIELTII